jgi:hypothetical protein
MVVARVAPLRGQLREQDVKNIRTDRTYGSMAKGCFFMGFLLRGFCGFRL